ncbi:MULTISPECIES: glutathione peroxidase [Leptospira]|uniref:Glutathione peroxidase n=5 Tax=Leptospira borgpetersenii TaxID=174 RepID=M3GI67_LEPBO|nr:MULTISPECIES: glutathione peroxidase [Leptospira]EMG00667.1 glutathione peroxidase [Leptospira borgpetersenii str. 200701203]EMO08462.1 glutathione peroxidase [Leptospira borgpetersenii str. Noumea 25]ALO28116.1 glutathione peroxidase [Leptospira borgpetersenii serovar Ballum]ANH02254.1 Glutathione peroxidase [Leptospira borgpetersenii str. 4E]AXX17015.1 glutathione peroxidase [Leptospira borgpetersenii serovar Ceylonica]
MTQTLYDLTATLNSGKEQRLEDYRGKVLLIVNTASECAFTPQYAGLQNLYGKYKTEGLEILGFPCDQFKHQEPGSDETIKNFCQKNYGVEFPIFKKIDVNGDSAHPVFRFLRKKASGFFGNSIKWNFTKFLVDKQGNVIKRYSPITTPEKIEKVIQDLLKK